MKRTLAIILVLALIMSSASIFVSAEHTHEAEIYDDLLRTEETHSYSCKHCAEVITEPHTLNVSGECVCGYVKHEHSAKLYANSFLGGTHTYLCDCGATVTEEHKIDENGECPCGYEEHTHVCDAYAFLPVAHIGGCTECYSINTEPHTFDEKGKCVCGYVDPDQASFFDTVFQPMLMVFSLYRYFISCCTLGFKYGWQLGLGNL